MSTGRSRGNNGGHHTGCNAGYPLRIWWVAARLCVSELVAYARERCDGVTGIQECLRDSGRSMYEYMRKAVLRLLDIPLRLLATG